MLRRTLASACSSTAESALTTPSSKTSQPIRPTSGLWLACQRRCSAAAEADLQPHLANGRGKERGKERGRSGRAGRARGAARPRPAATAGARSSGARACARTSAARPARLACEISAASQAAAFLIASARSVFSQEKPPSASGVRPKWP